MPKPVQVGRKERMTYAKINEVGEMPNLIEIQTKSYDWFIKEGLKEVFEDISPIRDYADNFTLEFVDHSLDDTTKYGEEECKERDVTYAAPLRVQVRLINKKTGEIKDQEVFMGDFPIMTNKGTFIYNGAERVIVTQLVRSPGAYFSVETDKSNNKLFSSQVIPNRGAWLEYETDSAGVISVRVDRTRKQPMTTLLRAMGISSNEDIIELFGSDERLLKTLEKDTTTDYESGIKEIYKKLRPGEPPTVDSAKSLVNSLFFDPKRYDLAKVGRYKYNKKLGLYDRIYGNVLAEDVEIPTTGEVIEKGTRLTAEQAQEVEDSGVYAVTLVSPNDANKTTKVVGNYFVATKEFVPFELDGLDIPEKVHYPTLKAILDEELDEETLKKTLEENKKELSPKNITVEDIFASVSYILNLAHGVGSVDDIDHLGNRRLRTVGELLQNQFRIGLARMERVVRERMTIQDVEAATPQALINIKPVTAAIKEFFGSSQLSQFMDQNNPLAELTHKRRLSALGPGGLSRERAGFEVRDVHHSHYGRMCPIETPEGPNIGLIGSLTTYGRIDEYGFIETPYRVVDKENHRVTDEVRYLTADKEEVLVIAQANEPLDEEGHFLNEKIACRGNGGEIALFPRNVVDLMDVSPKQVVSVATAMIPFLENDDANRALMGSNMQRQAVPLLVTEAPIVGTGMEYKAAKDSGVVIVSPAAGTIEHVDARTILLRKDEDGEILKFDLLKFKRSNQGTCINQRPIVSHGEHIEAGEVIADGPSTDMGEIALGKNLLVGFMTWEGYNYEDAIILNERLIMDDVLTSLHIVEYEAEARDTKLGPEDITRDIPNVGEDALKDLDEEGIIRIGAEVDSTDILVGKVTPKGESDLNPEEKLLRAIFGEKAREVRDTSLKVPHGETGIVVDVKIYTRENGDELPPGVNKLVRTYIATKRKINVGDKMAGRHGNKGVISTVLPEEDMPFLENGQPLQVMLNPLGVPSRMNVGQVLEVHLGLAAMKKGWYISTPVFDGANEHDIMDLLEDVGYSRSGKLKLRDGRTGEYFANPVTVGYMYMLKLHHLVDDKIHARSTGPYSLVTQQPLGGKAQFGGQRFGEMEVWALEAYGAAYTLQEILTVKSDDIVGRVQTYEAIVKGINIPEPGIPESFKVLIKEMQSLGLDVRVLSENDEEISLKEVSEYDAGLGLDKYMAYKAEIEGESPEDDDKESLLTRNGYVARSESEEEANLHDVGADDYQEDTDSDQEDNSDDDEDFVVYTESNDEDLL